MNTEKNILKKVYNAKSKEELMDAYDSWAKQYDSDLEEFGYEAPVESVRMFLRYVSADSHVLDAGCGTGLVGALLRDNGFSRLHGLDYSSMMLKAADKKRIYNKLFHADLTLPLDILPDTYDALICVGTFTYGHVSCDAFDSLVRIVRPGGNIVFTVREGAYDDMNYRDKMVQMEYEKLWELKEMANAVYFSGEKVNCKVCSYVVL